MEKLPVEILSNIAECLIHKRRPGWEARSSSPYPPIAQHSTISRRWQHVIEAITFRRLWLDQDRLVEAEVGGYLTPTRLAYIRSVLFDLALFPPDRVRPTNGQSEHLKGLFSTRTQRLFHLLAQLPQRENPSVTLRCISSDPHAINELYRSMTAGRVYDYLELPSDWDQHVQDLPAISNFEVGWPTVEFSPAPSSLIRMAAKMTRLNTIEWNISDAFRRDARAVRQRIMFADGLQKLPASLKSFDLRYPQYAERHTAILPTSYIPSDASEDILGQAFHTFTQRDGLEKFWFCGSLDSTLLWPQSRSLDDQPYWPTLRHLRIYLDEMLPSGQCIDISVNTGQSYFGSRDKRIPCNYEKTIYDQTVINQLALAAARAARHMPRIRTLEIACCGWQKIVMTFNTSREEPCLRLMGDPHLPKLTDETLEAWRETASEHGLEWEINYTSEFIPEFVVLEY